jgi:hypothetical protein
VGEKRVVLQDELKNEAEARRFLLGEMAADERIVFEQTFLADEVSFEQIRVVEDELLESYVRGTLTSVEKEKFERSFLTTDRRRDRVAFTRTMLDKLVQQNELAAAKKNEATSVNPSVWQLIADFFQTPQFAVSAAFVLLVLIFGGWFLLRDRNKSEPGNIVRQTTPPSIQSTPLDQPQKSPSRQNEAVNSNRETAENKNALPNANSKVVDKNPNSNAQRQIPGNVAPVLALSAGTVRGEGKLPQLNLPQGASGANLQLNIKGQPYRIYHAEIVDADGNLVLQINGLKPKNSRLSFFVPAAKLQEGDYLVKLSAVNRQDKSESVADYPFRVQRK